MFVVRGSDCAPRLCSESSGLLPYVMRELCRLDSFEALPGQKARNLVFEWSLGLAENPQPLLKTELRESRPQPVVPRATEMKP